METGGKKRQRQKANKWSPTNISQFSKICGINKLFTEKLDNVWPDMKTKPEINLIRRRQLEMLSQRTGFL